MIPSRDDDEQFDDDDEFSLGDDDEDDSFESDTDEENEADFDESWIAWFVRQRGNEFFCEVDREFINNPQNIAGLLTQVSHSQLALNVILDEKVAEHESLREDQRNIIEKQAEILYGLIHSRFINTTRGLRLMYSKYERGDFGKCPRFFCQNEKALPAAEYDSQGRGQLKQYCPRCEKLFLPGTKLHRDNGLDQQPGQPPNQRRGPPQKYIPRPYGFRLFTGSQRSLQETE
ncbi:MAG: putative casein kinase II subunit beta [Streblomastix strix]|uniref:Casein kinase II subunit beta n=1 Tax=Streblomastix strix TaxID=222440 RepID=A0A5J4W3J1_9EUKA|nr:MAG: putative casein kinase II subunit beta [Streblomastix strix]